jgi:hypothetical protein
MPINIFFMLDSPKLMSLAVYHIRGTREGGHHQRKNRRLPRGLPRGGFDTFIVLWRPTGKSQEG